MEIHLGKQNKKYLTEYKVHELNRERFKCL